MHGFFKQIHLVNSLMKVNFAYTFYFSLVLVLMMTGIKQMNAQITCDISINSDIPVCPGGEYTLSAPFHENATYQWKVNGTTIQSGPENSVDVVITEETDFSLTVKDTITQEDCMSDLVVTVHPPFTIVFDQLQLTCTASFTDDNPNKSKTARMQAKADGQFPSEDYTYLWDTRFVNPKQIVGDSTQIIGLGAFQIYPISVVDRYGCSTKDTARTEAYPNTDCEIITDPDTAYIQNPKITFTYINHEEENVPVSNLIWNFGDCDCLQTIKPDCCFELETTQENPTHAYDTIGKYNPYLITYNKEGCDTLFGTEVWINPVKLLIPNVFTPNGDGINETFIISEDKTGGSDDNQKSVGAEYESYDPLNTYYLSSELHIFNRWGRIVYTSGDYQNDWDGGKLPDGVYFYVLKCHGAKSDEVYQGSVTIFGSGR